MGLGSVSGGWSPSRRTSCHAHIVLPARASSGRDMRSKEDRYRYCIGSLLQGYEASHDEPGPWFVERFWRDGIRMIAAAFALVYLQLSSWRMGTS